MDAQITLGVDHAKVLSAPSADETRGAELSAELVTENEGEQVLVAAPENTRFELHDDQGTLLEVLHVRSASIPGNPDHQLDPGQTRQCMPGSLWMCSRPPSSATRPTSSSAILTD